MSFNPYPNQSYQSRHCNCSPYGHQYPTHSNCHSNQTEGFEIVAGLIQISWQMDSSYGFSIKCQILGFKELDECKLYKDNYTHCYEEKYPDGFRYKLSFSIDINKRCMLCSGYICIPNKGKITVEEYMLYRW